MKTGLACLFSLLFFSFSLNAGIVIDTAFEGSNTRVISIDSITNSIKIESIKKRNDVLNVVFFFKVSGFDSTRTFTIKVKYSQQVYAPVLAAYSYDKTTWFRTTGNFSGDSKEYSGIFSGSSIYFAHGFPYTYSRLSQLETQFSGNPFVSIGNVSISEQGRAVKLFKFTNPSVPDSPKCLIWLLGRNHAFEAHSNYVLEGLMLYLSSADERAARLRNMAIIYVVPMMDVDMAAIGGTGKDQLPIDFNRDWDSPSYWNAVKDVKNKIIQTSQQNKFRIFIDSHNPFPGDSDTSTRLFFYSMHDTGIRSLNLNTFRTKLFQNGNYYWGRKLIYPTSGQTSSKWVDSMFTTLDFSTSLETGWENRTDGSRWTIPLYLINGSIIGKAISDYIYQSTPVRESAEILSNEITAFPNPFNSEVVIKFSVMKKDDIKFTLFDMSGKEIRGITFSGLQSGTYRYSIESNNLSSGIYFLRITGQDIFKTKKLILIK